MARCHQGGNTPSNEKQNSPGVVQFSVSQVAQFSMSLDMLYNYRDPLEEAGTANLSLNCSLASNQVLPVLRGRISTQGSPCRSSSTACGRVLLNTSFKAPVLVLPSRNQMTCGGGP